MNNQNVREVGARSIGIPAVVVGVLIALKHIGMTSISYSSIIWFGLEVWLVCIFIVLVIALIVGMIICLFERY
jgi:hypothetical protein